MPMPAFAPLLRPLLLEGADVEEEVGVVEEIDWAGCCWNLWKFD